ncbi:MAG: HAD-IIIC family phosphatase [Verrucomicrobiota bacterium]
MGRLTPWIYRIHFKKWAKLLADGSNALVPLQSANRFESVNNLIGKGIYLLPDLLKKPTLMPWRYRSLRHKAIKNLRGQSSADYFLLEVYNPNQEPVRLTVYMRSKGLEHQALFAAPLTISSGLQRIRIPCNTIKNQLDLQQSFELEISPSDTESTALLYFGAIDFVKDTSYVSPASMGSCKCVVWDLDNTVWNGTLIEDGISNLKIRDGVKDIIEELDKRGILNSIASKNNETDVMPALRKFGIEEYFVKPQISWNPKGEAIKRIARELNIGIDTLLYIDDSPFERDEVAQTAPEVTIIDAIDLISLPWMEETQSTTSSESSNRRQYYIQQGLRDAALEKHSDNYEEFLRTCEIRMTVLPVTTELLPRVHELAQRTNQMNFSGNRYDLETFRDLLKHEHIDCHAIEVVDRYGSYGIVGFAVFDSSCNTLIDLAFSCRVQSKRIEHALLSHLLNKYPTRPFIAFWRKTERNTPAGRVFEELGFVEVENSGETKKLLFDKALVQCFDYIQILS